MRHRISPLRYAFESILDWFGLGPRHSLFSPARDPESRLRFARYIARIQPAPDPEAARKTAQLLTQSGAVSSGIVRHAPMTGRSEPKRQPEYHLFTQPGSIAARRRALAVRQSSGLFKTLLHALRVR